MAEHHSPEPQQEAPKASWGVISVVATIVVLVGFVVGDYLLDAAHEREARLTQQPAAAEAPAEAGAEGEAAPEGEGEAAVAVSGDAVFQSAGCGACHAVGGQGGKVGPALDGVGAKGKDHIRESIVQPDKVVAEGYAAGLMPKTFEKTLKPAELDALVDWLASK